MTALEVPNLSLVVLVGASGSGKSTFAREHFGRYEVVSSDVCRGLVADDEDDQSVTAEAFALLGEIVSARLRLGRLTVVDATNVQAPSRASLVRIAKDHDVLPVAIVLDVPERDCVRRNAGREDRTFGAEVVHRQHAQLRQGMRRLRKEGFRTVHVLDGVEAVDAATVVRRPLRSDLRDRHGPFDVVGDVHGCRSELETLLHDLGYVLSRDADGRPVDAEHPDGRTAVFLGDLVDRGPDSPGVLRLVMGMVRAGHALCVPGNHEARLVRALRGKDVRRTHGLAETLDQLATETPEVRADVERWCDGLVAHLVLDGGRLVVAHAGLKEEYHGRASGRVRSFALYGDTTGETDEYGLPVRYPWAEEYRGAATVLYGHTPVPEPEWVNRTLCLDTGCVFGGRLTALRYPEQEIVSVPAERVWHEPVRPLAPVVAEREHDQLLLADVQGRRVVETSQMGRITVQGEQAAGALEVMSRFAMHPRWVRYLPPTMSPVATSAREDLLEHPDEAFSFYAKQDVHEVVCQEKHMGSRAVVLVHRDEGAGGVLHTRTGRAFFDRAASEALLARVRAALEADGTWAELGTEWLLLDAELLPWSAKAEGLLREQFAPVAATARSSFALADRVLSAARSRGLDVADLLERTRSRAEDVEAFAEAYRRYCWPTDGADGVRIAPFQVLASQGRTYAEQPHAWHLALADRWVEADPGTFRATRRVDVTVGDAASTAAATRWWESLCAEGGEGMVVKPAANLVRGRRGLVQPGLKVRGREYLRLVYGPEYTRPENLLRLRDRSLGRKRSLALREYALGLEALERTARDEPLWRVHEAVFAVLALESDPVDPRL